MLSEEQGKKILKLARSSIETYFSKKELDLEQYSGFDAEQGVFVTLHKEGKLRGCIGFPYPKHKLYDAVFEAARAAAFEDPRFSPVEEIELDSIDIEISVLTPIEELPCTEDECIADIKIGEDGLILKSPLSSGLLLPQVFTEHRCTPLQALEMTCEKAGLPEYAWKDSSVKVFRFQAQIFKEKN